MKLYKTASGENKLSIEKEEWAKIGIEKGWMIPNIQTAQGTPVITTAQTQPASPVWQCKTCGRRADSKEFIDNDDHCWDCDSIYINKFQ